MHLLLALPTSKGDADKIVVAPAAPTAKQLAKQKSALVKDIAKLTFHSQDLNTCAIISTRQDFSTFASTV